MPKTEAVLVIPELLYISLNQPFFRNPTPLTSNGSALTCCVVIPLFSGYYGFSSSHENYDPLKDSEDPDDWLRNKLHTLRQRRRNDPVSARRQVERDLLEGGFDGGIWRRSLM